MELLEETPNELGASATLANANKECRYYFWESPLAVPETPSASQLRDLSGRTITTSNSPRTGWGGE